jgi:4-diphosphocytidyl-2C-methyl-D-erythritol kinase
MTELANAKINLCLNVVRKRSDGYHELEMVMVPLALHDVLSVDEANEIIITSDDSNMPCDSSNTIYKAISLMKKTFDIKQNYKVHVEKRIPMQAGLAGGSSDAAATIRAINKLAKLNLNEEELISLAKQVGADVPFCLINRPAVVKGIGEFITPFEMKMQYHVLLVKPNKGVSTKEAFETLDFTKTIHPNVDLMSEGLILGNEQMIKDNLQNTLEQSAFELVPEIDVIKKDLLECGFEMVLMSGSGSTVFALSENEKLIDSTKETFKTRYEFVVKTKILG